MSNLDEHMTRAVVHAQNQDQVGGPPRLPVTIKVTGTEAALVVADHDLSMDVHSYTVHHVGGKFPRVRLEFVDSERVGFRAEEVEVRLGPASRAALIRMGWAPPPSAQDADARVSAGAGDTSTLSPAHGPQPTGPFPAGALTDPVAVLAFDAIGHAAAEYATAHAEPVIPRSARLLMAVRVGERLNEAGVRIGEAGSALGARIAATVNPPAAAGRNCPNCHAAGHDECQDQNHHTTMSAAAFAEKPDPLFDVVLAALDQQRHRLYNDARQRPYGYIDGADLGDVARHVTAAVRESGAAESSAADDMEMLGMVAKATLGTALMDVESLAEGQEGEPYGMGVSAAAEVLRKLVDAQMSPTLPDMIDMGRRCFEADHIGKLMNAREVRDRITAKGTEQMQARTATTIHDMEHLAADIYKECADWLTAALAVE